MTERRMIASITYKQGWGAVGACVCGKEAFES